MEEEVLRRTRSVCPICLKRIPAERVRVGGRVFLRKTCDAHGVFQTVLWRGFVDLDDWIGGAEDAAAGDGNPSCPGSCGLCSDHLQQTCCVILEVTDRCNLACPYCFADGGGDEEPSFETIRDRLFRLADPGKTLVQLSGGEPTLRNDLPEIVAAALEAGCRYVQLNTNGIRLAEDRDYLKALVDAGLSFVFLQFDGTEDSIYDKLRGRPLLGIKERAIANCAARNLGVTLVPTLVPGVNTWNIGEILRFGVSRSPAVRGVHFQPVTYLGRMPAPPSDDMRLTLDELLAGIEDQTMGLIRAENLMPSRCNHPLCGFHGDFMTTANGRLIPLSKRRETGSGCCAGAAEQNRAFVGRRWQRPSAASTACCEGGPMDMDAFLDRVKSHGFTVTAMAFQDAGNLDLERLRRCSLHVFLDGRFVPFCSRYLSPWTP